MTFPLTPRARRKVIGNLQNQCTPGLEACVTGNATEPHLANAAPSFTYPDGRSEPDDSQWPWRPCYQPPSQPACQQPTKSHLAPPSLGPTKLILHGIGRPKGDQRRDVGADSGESDAIYPLSGASHKQHTRRPFWPCRCSFCCLSLCTIAEEPQCMLTMTSAR